jgi:hypothetical protein
LISDATQNQIAIAPRKRVGIMQPYFFPYFEQFRLIAACDIWVVFDTVQYTRKSWMNRNRIINKDKGWSYVSVPVRKSGIDTLVKDAQVDEQQDWRRVILDKLRVYEREAPQYRRVRELVADAISVQAESVAALNAAVLRNVTAYLGIRTPLVMASTLHFEAPFNCQPGEWALHISKHLQATEYRNSAGGVELFDPALYACNGIELSFHQHRERRYSTGSMTFIEGLSVIDWLMWNEVELLQSWLTE